MDDCCGCNACSQACAHACITMQPNAEGFLMPVVDRAHCVDCGLCEMVCPVKNAKPIEPKQPQVYIGRTTEEQLLASCASGGMAYLLSAATIEKGGVVFGVRFDDQWNAVYDYAETKEQLELFKGSKYIDAVVGNSYMQVKQFLQSGREVLFIGTPCHVSGLNHYLRKPYNNLLTVDIMCHAVPSPLVWQTYLKSLTKELITNVSFRSKAFGWENYAIRIETDNHQLVHEPNDKNIYMQGFLQGLTVRTSCANCCARGFTSGSNIMIGDYWELSKNNPELYDDKGMSLVFAFTAKGESYLTHLPQQVLFEQIPWEHVDTQEMHGTLFRSTRLHPNRKRFFDRLPKTRNIQKHIQLNLKISSGNPVKRTIKKVLKRLKALIVK